MKQEIQNNFLLLDTCVISDAFRYLHNENMKDFFNSIKEKQCRLCINDLIILEFIRVAKTAKLKNEIKKYLEEFYESLPDRGIIELAKEIYPLYNFCSTIKNQKQVSVVDVINVAFLSHFEGKLFFVTFDNHDFPLEIVNRVDTGTIDVGSDILTWGIYSFNRNGYESLKKHYAKT